MSKVLFNGEWFKQISVSALYETEYERVFSSNVELIYPGYYLVPFKLTVSDEADSAKADFALIHKECRDWWIVEVELGSHPLEGHVLPQVRTLSRAVYGQREAEYLCAKQPSLEKDRVAAMMKGQQPRVLVMVNTPKPDWVEPLKRFDALVGVFEIFRSERNRYVFRLNGEHPPQIVELVSDCYFDRLLPRFLVIQSPGILRCRHGERLVLQYDDGVSEWERIDIENMVYLSPIGANPLNAKDKYELLRLESGSMTIRRKT
jgi:hypothetical protein